MLVGFDHQCFRYIYICIINPSEIGVRFTNLANELGHRLVIWSYLAGHVCWDIFVFHYGQTCPLTAGLHFQVRPLVICYMAIDNDINDHISSP